MILKIIYLINYLHGSLLPPLRSVAIIEKHAQKGSFKNKPPETA